jgi:hypothetical protein
LDAINLKGSACGDEVLEYVVEDVCKHNYLAREFLKGLEA